MANDNEPVSAAELSPTPAKPSKLAKVGAVASKVLLAAKWVWSIPGVKSAFKTRVIQEIIKNATVAAFALAVAEKALGS